MLTGYPQSWLLVALIIVIGASVRHFIKRHDAHDPLSNYAWALPIAAVALAVAFYLTVPRGNAEFAGLVVSDGQALNIVGKHCVMCHSGKPSHEGFDAPPKDVALTTLDDLRKHAEQIMAQAVHGDTMPLGNETRMTSEERRDLGAWLANQ
jgi:uncharacterized membrane protein